MSRPRSLSFALVLAYAGLALAVAGPAAADPRYAGPAPAAEELGPFAVGRTTITLVDPSRGDRTFPVDVWYPVDPEDAVGPPSVYDLIFTGLPSPLALDAPPPSSAGPFPLIAFSHGNNGIRFQSFFLAEHLASHGFVVAAPDHVGNTAIDLLNPGAIPFEARDRPLDVSLVITALLALGEPGSGDPLEGRIHPGQVGVAGHSFGGFTTLAMVTGFADVPPDPRVQAIVPISPASGGFSDAQLASISRPTLLVGGTADVTTPIVSQTTRPWALIGTPNRWRVDVVDAGHNSFTEICALGGALLGAGIPPFILDFLLGSADEGCAPTLIPIERAHELTNLYVTAFFKRKLVGDFRYAETFTPEVALALGDVVYFEPGGGCAAGVGVLAFMPVMVVWRVRRRAA